MMKHVLIIEDETPAYDKLISLLQEIMDAPFTHNWAKSNQEAKTKILSHEKYDLIIADIQLRDGTSFDAFSETTITCPIIFCTAYNDYLLDAFNTNGIAYILKPYTKEQLQKAMDKYETLYAKNQTPSFDKGILASLENALQRDIIYKTRFVIKRQNKSIHLLPVEEITLIEAEGDFSKLHTAEGKFFLYSENIGSIIQKLDPKKFFRINRSSIIQLQAIEKIDPYFKNRLLLKVKGYPKQVTTSSTMTADFRKWLEG